MPKLSDTDTAILDPSDLQSSTWIKVRQFMMQRKLAAVIKLANPSCPTAETDLLRARIVELDALLNLDPRMAKAEVCYQFR